MPVASEDLSDFYDARSSEKYATSDNPEMLKLVDRIVSWCNISDGSRLLDFGCFDGYLLSRVGQRRSVDAVGIDISIVALRRARQTSDEQISWVVAGNGGLPFFDQQFDVVICSEILEHVEDLDETLSELTRVLEPGGRLYATMPNDLDLVWAPLRGVCRKVDQVEGHLRRMRLEDFCKAGMRLGLEVERTQYRGFLFSAVWYRLLIYSPRVKERGMTAVHSSHSALATLAQHVAYVGMRAYLWGDSWFSKSPRCMGFDVTFVKPELS